MNDNNQEYLTFREALCSIFETPKGIILKKGLIKLYVDQSCLADTSERTHYLLGQKELIQALIKDSETPLKQEDFNTRGNL